jgi:hypothetical protein
MSVTPLSSTCSGYGVTVAVDVSVFGTRLNTAAVANERSVMHACRSEVGIGPVGSVIVHFSTSAVDAAPAAQAEVGATASVILPARIQVS